MCVSPLAQQAGGCALLGPRALPYTHTPVAYLTMATTVAAADQQAKALSLAKVIADAQEKTKQYLGRIEAAVDDSPRQCIAESRLDQQLVGHSKRTVGKVCLTVVSVCIVSVFLNCCLTNMRNTLRLLCTTAVHCC